MTQIPQTLLLASASRYRRELLARLIPDPRWQASNVDECRQSDEAPARMALRLATAKATAVSHAHGSSVVIGSDQVACIGEQVLGKPGNHHNAAKQLADCSGQEVQFYTAVCVLRQQPGFSETHTNITTVRFRTLTAADIDSYLRRDQPWDCAGSFRSEGLGIALLESMHTTDPSALIGLPLIWLAGSLQRAGVRIL